MSKYYFFFLFLFTLSVPSFSSLPSCTVCRDSSQCSSHMSCIFHRCVPPASSVYKLCPGRLVCASCLSDFDCRFGLCRNSRCVYKNPASDCIHGQRPTCAYCDRHDQCRGKSTRCTQHTCVPARMSVEQCGIDNVYMSHVHIANVVDPMLMAERKEEMETLNEDDEYAKGEDEDEDEFDNELDDADADADADADDEDDYDEEYDDDDDDDDNDNDDDDDDYDDDDNEYSTEGDDMFEDEDEIEDENEEEDGQARLEIEQGSVDPQDDELDIANPQDKKETDIDDSKLDSDESVEPAIDVGEIGSPDDMGKDDGVRKTTSSSASRGVRFGRFRMPSFRGPRDFRVHGASSMQHEQEDKNNTGYDPTKWDGTEGETTTTMVNENQSGSGSGSDNDREWDGDEGVSDEQTNEEMRMAIEEGNEHEHGDMIVLEDELTDDDNVSEGFDYNDGGDEEEGDEDEDDDVNSMKMFKETSKAFGVEGPIIDDLDIELEKKGRARGRARGRGQGRRYHGRYGMRQDASTRRAAHEHSVHGQAATAGMGHETETDKGTENDEGRIVMESDEDEERELESANANVGASRGGRASEQSLHVHGASHQDDADNNYFQHDEL